MCGVVRVGETVAEDLSLSQAAIVSQQRPARRAGENDALRDCLRARPIRFRGRLSARAACDRRRVMR